MRLVCRSAVGRSSGLASGRTSRRVSQVDCTASTSTTTSSDHGLRLSTAPFEADEQVVFRSAALPAIRVFFRTAPLCIAYVGPFYFRV